MRLQRGSARSDPGDGCGHETEGRSLDLDGDGRPDLAALPFGPPLPDGRFEARLVVFHEGPDRTYALVEARYVEVRGSATLARNAERLDIGAGASW